MSQYPHDPYPPQHSQWPFSPPTYQQAGSPPGGLPPPRLKGFTIVAWIVIVLVALLIAVTNHTIARNPQPAPGTPDTIGLVVLEIQGKYLVGASQHLMGGEDGRSLYLQSADVLGVGTFDQRLRFVVLAAELAGRDEAAEQVVRIEEDLAKTSLQLATNQELAFEIVARLYEPQADGESDDSGERWLDAVDALNASERQLLVNELGWFGELALFPPPSYETSQAQRLMVLAPAKRLFVLLIGGIMLAILAGIAGFAGLVALIVLAFSRRLKGGIGAPHIHHGIYAETFAVWLLLFLAIMLGCGVVAQLPGAADHAMAITFIGFLISLLALLWPRIRGATWSEIRRDIGWTMGRSPAAEPFLGLAGYAMTLPLLGIGILLTLVLITIQGLFQQVSQEPFQPMGGPAHPVLGELAGGNVWAAVQVLLVASIAAPIVEETMFRGVLYRSLRDGTWKLGPAMSILFSALLNALIFAMIHPQGWVAIPALGSLAVAFCLMREWRGTVLPSMLMHGLSNSIVMGFVIIALQR